MIWTEWCVLYAGDGRYKVRTHLVVVFGFLSRFQLRIEEIDYYKGKAIYECNGQKRVNIVDINTLFCFIQFSKYTFPPFLFPSLHLYV